MAGHHEHQGNFGYHGHFGYHGGHRVERPGHGGTNDSSGEGHPLGHEAVRLLNSRDHLPLYRTAEADLHGFPHVAFTAHGGDQPARLTPALFNGDAPALLRTAYRPPHEPDHPPDARAPIPEEGLTPPKGDNRWADKGGIPPASQIFLENLYQAKPDLTQTILKDPDLAKAGERWKDVVLEKYGQGDDANATAVRAAINSALQAERDMQTNLVTSAVRVLEQKTGIDVRKLDDNQRAALSGAIQDFASKVPTGELADRLSVANSLLMEAKRKNGGNPLPPESLAAVLNQVRDMPADQIAKFKAEARARAQARAQTRVAGHGGRHGGGHGGGGGDRRGPPGADDDDDEAAFLAALLDDAKAHPPASGPTV
jgi:hypothetical protein